ncbi:MAG TPA: hypothetical protein DCR21_00460 [Succinivibrionaceae bacterium]|nr:hypothetical protein [Succinivibrionaceae bacterium]
MKIIVQAGGRGSRLEGLTRNKPKCLVPVDNLPIIFHLFKKYREAEFLIIADYKSPVLEKYLSVFADEYTYRIIVAKEKGTVSGIKQALNFIKNDESVFIVWSDLVLPDSLILPEKKGNYVGIANDFLCRWSYIDKNFVKTPSRKDGVAGFFIFENKNVLKDIPQAGALVDWLKTQHIDFERLEMHGTYEIGTLLAYERLETNEHRCRPFNSMEISEDTVIKSPLGEYGKKIAEHEIGWYKHVKKLGYEFIPEIESYEPLVMRRVTGKNLYEYDCLTLTQKKSILKAVIHTLNELHHIEPELPADLEALEENYILKTFDRLKKVKDLVPFANQEFIKINHQYYRNVFFCKEELKAALRAIYPKSFRLIHGDCTFSNIMFDTFNMKTVLIDPRGYFGSVKYYGAEDYDWAKLYYSIAGDYDQFNQKKFTLDIRENDVELAIRSNNWSDIEDYFFELLPDVSKDAIKLLHAVIWLSLTTYAWEDYDSICGAFYNGLIKLGDVL